MAIPIPVIILDSIRKAIIIKGVLSAIFTLLAAAFFYILFRNGYRSSGIFAMLFCVLVLYLCAVALLGLDVWIYVAAEHSPSNCFAGICFRVVTGIDSVRYAIIYTSFEFLSFFLSDCIVVWRSWVLWRRSYLILTISISLLSATFATSVYTLFRFATKVGQVIVTPISGAHLPAMAITSLALSLVVNFWTTALVATRTWQYREVLSLAHRRHGSVPVSQKIMILLIESGAIYFVIWLVYFIALFPASRELYRFGYYFNTVIPYAAGLYPTAIFVLIGLHKSFRDHVFTDAVLNDETPAPELSLITVGITFITQHTATTTSVLDVEPGVGEEKLWLGHHGDVGVV